MAHETSIFPRGEEQETADALSRHLPAGAPLWLRQTAWAVDSFLHHDMSTYAAALAYRGLLALFPFVIFVIAIVNVLDIWRVFEMFADWARSAPAGRVPAAIREWMVWQARDRPQGAVLSVGALAAVWAVASGVRVLRRALTIAADAEEVQPAWLRFALSLVAAPILGAGLLAAFLLFTVTRRVLLRVAAWFSLNDAVLTVWDWLRVPGGLLIVWLVVSAAYRFAPSQRQSFRAVMPGAVFAAVVLAAASLIFSRAVSNVTQFGVTYGSFAAAIVLLVYLYLVSAGLLLGAELNAVLRSGRPSAGSASQE